MVDRLVKDRKGAAAPANAGSRRGRPLDSLREGTKKSLNAALIEKLRTDILMGAIIPAVKLKIPDICDRYDVSAGVAREALSRLVPEGLVDFTDQRGFSSPTLTIDDIRDITRVRIFIEREALLDAMRNGDDTWEGGILAAQHRLDRCERDADDVHFRESMEWSARHREFHQALVAGCTSGWLLRLHDMFYNQTERYRFISARASAEGGGKRRNVIGEHGSIVEAVLARDEVRAVDLLEKHLARTSERVIAALREKQKTAK